MAAALSVYPADLTVSEKELKSVKKVRFENYTGEPSKREAPARIRGIGAYLSRRANGTVNRRVDYYLKYSIIHAVSNRAKERLSADIFSVHRQAKVNHIRNIRRIISGYLQTEYGYNAGEAAALALFVTYYNAVYRGNMTYISKTYKPVVVGHLTADTAGLAIDYREWPGKTRVLIPLSGGDINPDIISGKKVKREVRKDDRNIKPRKTLVTIKKKKINRESTELKKRETDLSAKKRETEKEKEQVKRNKRELEKEKEKLKKEKERIEKIKDPEKRLREEKKRKEKEKKIRRREKRVDKTDRTVKKKEKEIRDKTSEIKKKKEKLTEKKRKLKEEEREIQDDEDRKKINEKLAEVKKKENELKKKEDTLNKREDRLRDKQPDKKIYAEKFFYLKIKNYLEGGHYNNELYMLNAANGKVEFKSPVTNICGRRYDVFSGGIIVITHKGAHKRGHFLTLIDRKTLKAKVRGEDIIFWRSFVEVKNGYIYAIVERSGSYYLGKFNEKLKRVAVSSVAVHRDTFITFYGDYIYVNRKDKRVLMLKQSDLTQAKEIDVK